MAQVCNNCGKGRQKATSWKKIMSKLDPTDRYFQKPNLHEVKLKTGKKAKVCTKCQRKLAKENKLN